MENCLANLIDLIKTYQDKIYSLSLNEENKYNQNFNGLYCSCKRPYPDPEDNVDDEMIQCVICEDWFHGRHLGIQELPSNYEYQEMVCTNCMTKNDFLWAYTLHSVDITEVKDESNVKHEIDVDSVPTDVIQVAGKEQGVSQDVSQSSKSADAAAIKDEVKSDSKEEKPEADKDNANHKDDTSSSSHTKPSSVVDSDSNGKPSETNNEEKEKSRQDSGETSDKTEDGKSSSSSSSSCQLEQLKNRTVKKTDGAIFWKNSWRSKLCACQSCMEMYQRLHVEFLVREDDTVLAYEERGKLNQSGMSQYEKGIQALSHLDRTQQVEVLQGYNDMKTELRDFLQSFADKGKVVKTEDINNFFGEMQARKRQKTDSMQYFCR
ncbi:hypothetical protein BSL78_10971 [Apostichopus japonicus]|uniref:Putative E3 ubiquitin-protein ligase UBR7 n=1 Tax=Stichopus japonicus TaxID=307972 RepID=A0A2G8KVT5_STIJA|nr:hypothetical protein BSL78_10971 [Apostichopus japonicus]